MFHLFDRVYLEFDTKISSEIKRIVISERYAAPLEQELDGSQLEQIYYGQFVTDLIGENKEFATDLDFFKALKILGDAHSKPLIVYCDKNAFLHLFISWHKSILENVSQNILWKIFRFYVEKETYLSKITVQSPGNFESRPLISTFEQFQIENWNQSDFNTKCDEISNIKDREWNSSMISNFGVEYLLSTHLTNTSNDIKNSLKNKILLLSLRSILSEVYESKFHLIRHYQNKKLHDILGVEDIASLHDLFSHSRLSIYKDSTIWDESNVLYPSTQGSSLNVLAMNSEQITKLIDAFKLVRIEFDGMNFSNPQFDIINRLPMAVANSMTDQELTDLLNNDSFFGTSICEGVDMEKVNVLFIDWCLKLLRTNNTTTINGCSIAL